MDELYPHKAGLEMSEQEPDVSGIVTLLEGKRDEAVRERADVEARWLRDLQQFEGNTLDRITKGAMDYKGAVSKTPPVVHLTRTRTLAIAARIINMLVPSNERSWDIEATPVPTMARAAEDQTPVTDPQTGQVAMVPDGMQGMPQGMAPGMQPGMASPQGMTGQPMRPVTKADLARLQLDEADQRADLMRKHMDDQLTECHYNAEQRRVIMDGCKIGTGVLEGPVVAGSYRKCRSQLPDGQWMSQMQETPTPEYKSVDPWNFYPLPAEHISRCEGVFIDRLMTRRELQELKLLPGFDVDMISEILREEPSHSESYSQSLVSRANITGETVNTKKRYGVWKYTGSLSRSDMETLSIDVDEELDVVDPIIEAWFCNGRLMKVKRHPLEGAYRLPYYVWNYEPSEVSMFGYGVPYFMRDSDRVIQSTWHMILHNAALSAGPQMVRHKGTIEPADGSEEITGGMKQWYFSDPDKTISDAFQLFQIDARIDELSAVHDRARQNADEELAFPLIAQGEPTEAVPTASGLAMLMNASNVVQRRIAQSYDDEVIEPSIVALYDYNMIYLDDEEAKGDMRIKPLGATKLVVKDMQVQHLMVIANMTTNDRFAPFMKDDELLRQILKGAEMDADSLMKSKEDLANQGPSPKEQAELEQMQAETEKLRAETQKMGMDMQQGPEGPPAMSAKEMAEIQFQYEKLKVELQIQEMKLQGSALEAAKAENIKVADIQARFQLGARADETKRMLAQIEARRKEMIDGYTARLKAEEISLKKVNMQRGFDTY